MIYNYQATEGIPNGHYFIEEITQFGDFELEELKRITWYSDNKDELIELCKANNWPCPDAKNADAWFTHHIKYKNVFGTIEI